MANKFKQVRLGGVGFAHETPIKVALDNVVQACFAPAVYLLTPNIQVQTFPGGGMQAEIIVNGEHVASAFKAADSPRWNAISEISLENVTPLLMAKVGQALLDMSIICQDR